MVNSEAEVGSELSVVFGETKHSSFRRTFTKEELADRAANFERQLS